MTLKYLRPPPQVRLLCRLKIWKWIYLITLLIAIEMHFIDLWQGKRGRGDFLLVKGEDWNCYLWRGKRGRGGCCRDKRGGGRTTTSKFHHDSFMMMMILKVLLWCITSGGEGPVSRTWVWSRGPWGKGIITTVIFNHFRAGDLKTWIAPWQCGWRRWRRISKVASPSGCFWWSVMGPLGGNIIQRQRGPEIISQQA